ncbi:MAG: macro domain-containing protein [Thiobacillaceae bacterium]|jgi:O-acetyl-ADP-ribose deacetylase (regulator of RNase III)|nr:macro domain-containing protein [Thiobacillaceae bacterium]
MLHDVTGDILLSDASAVAHGVAPNDGHNQGLALSLRENWPAMYKDFRHYCQTTHPKAGGLWAWAGAEGKRVVALFTQDAAYGQGAKPGRANGENLNHALKALRKWAEDEKVTSLALPRVATGVGGMDWNEVRPLIEKHLGDLAIPVYLYVTYHKGEKASEPA